MLDLDDRAQTLLQPVLAVLHHGLSLLPASDKLQVRVGSVDRDYWRLVDGTLVLSAWLEGPELTHPSEGDLVPPLDRWRRAAGSVLEAACTLELARRAHRSPDTDWRWAGAAVHAADRVAPDLGLAAPELALALNTGDLGAHPRAGVAAMRAWEARDTDPMEQVRYLVSDGVISGPEWASLGEWVFSSAGVAAQLPVVVRRLAPSDVPTTLPPWSWQPLLVPAHRRGGRLQVDGGGAVCDTWAPADSEHRTMAGAAGSTTTISPRPGGPVGSWEVASAEGFGQVMGARGVSFLFAADGGLQIVLADAAVGPLAAMAVAEQVGTSGVCSARWAVAGRQLLSFDGVRTESLTMHGRSRDRFMVPASGFGIAEWLEALGDSDWGWQHMPPDRLVMRGQMMGGQIEVRLRRAD